MNDTTQGSVRERAAAAYAERQAQEADDLRNANAEHAKRFQCWLEKTFGITPEALEAEGIKACYEGGNMPSMRLKVQCPRCGKPVLSREIRDWAALGAQLEKTTIPSYGHECIRPGSRPVKSAGERLIELLAECMDEYNSGA